MKKISLFIVGFLIFSSIGLTSFTLAEQESQNSTISATEIQWIKHTIDNDFQYAFGVCAYDVDKDGDCDILGAAEQGNYIAWWRNDGGNPISWTKKIIDDNFEGATSVFAVDIDNDFDVDIFGSAGRADEIALWINDGQEPISWTKTVIRTGFDFAHEVYCYDLDQDEDIDILGSSSDDNQIVWWRNDGGNPISWTEQIITTTFYGAKCARVADLDNDGALDVIGAAFYVDKISWWRNLGGDPIEWEEHIITTDFDGAHRIELCDIDFDGDIDFIGAGYFQQEISIWRNDGGSPITWTKHEITTGFNGACIGLPIDIDKDGDIDVVGTAQQDNEVAVFLNQGNISDEWEKIIIDNFYVGAWPGIVRDIDFDGDTDIIAGASFRNKLSWWENDLSQKPFKPNRPSGPASGKTGIEYSYSSSTTDPYDLELYYQFDWGDGNFSEWIGPYPSGEECSTTYSWKTNGNYNVRVKAKNGNDSESEWSNPLPITMPKNKIIIFCNYLIDWLAERLSHFTQIFR